MTGVRLHNDQTIDSVDKILFPFVIHSYHTSLAVPEESYTWRFILSIERDEALWSI